FAHLDSGSLYRLVALGVIDAGGDPTMERHAMRAARQVNASQRDNPRIRSAEIGRAASLVSVFPGVRAALLEFQRDFAKHPPGGEQGAVIDGRDIGTVICPNADAKLFINAAPEIRAHRRWLELGERGEAADASALLKEIKERDARDSTRAISPLRPAPDAL